MSDNLHRYRAIREALIQGYRGELHGRGVQHLTTLAAFISGIVGSNSRSKVCVKYAGPMELWNDQRFPLAA